MNETSNTPTFSSDEELGENIRRTLGMHFWIPKGIRFEVRDGWVTLAGSVDWLFERSAIEHAVAQVRGMRGLTNSIHVECTPISSHRGSRCVSPVDERHVKLI